MNWLTDAGWWLASNCILDVRPSSGAGWKEHPIEAGKIAHRASHARSVGGGGQESPFDFGHHLPSERAASEGDVIPWCRCLSGDRVADGSDESRYAASWQAVARWPRGSQGAATNLCSEDRTATMAVEQVRRAKRGKVPGYSGRAWGNERQHA
jgi:hypothetical protein